jgi:hypothetical protein
MLFARCSWHYTLNVMQRLQQLPIPLRILAYAAAAAVLTLAAGVGVVAGLTLGSDGGSPEGARPERTAGATPGQGGKSGEDAEGRASAA